MGTGNCGYRLSVCGLGVGFGVVNALWVLVIGLLALMMHGFGAPVIHLMGSVYVGFAAKPLGVLIGVVWALVDGFIAGVIVGVVYNYVAARCPCKGCKAARGEGVVETKV